MVLFYTTSALTKLSIICFNARLTGMTSVFWTWTHRAFFVVIVCYWLITFFYQLLLCSPPFSNKSLIWQGQHGPSKCRKGAEPLGITTSVMHMAFDWVLLAVPIYLVLKLQMSWTKKLQCVIPLSLGALSSAGACVRTYDGLHPAKDPTHHLIYQTGWNVCDFLLAVTVTSLPACKKVLADLTSNFSNRYFFTINGSQGSPSPRSSPPSSDDRSERQRRVSQNFDVESMATNQMVDDRSTRALYLKDWRTPGEGEVQLENEVLKAGGGGSSENRNPFDDRRFLQREEV